MKGGPFVRKFVLSTGFMATIPAIIIIFFLPSLGSKYTLTVKPNSNRPGQYVYTDLNSDSVSEVIHIGKGVPYYFLTARDNDNRIFDQWNLKDSINSSISEVFIGDYDHDRIKEIYVFSFKHDSLFLNVNEILEPRGTLIDRIYITKIGYVNGEITSFLYPCGFFDENGDGFDELYFGITSAFGLGPRRIYAFDLKNKTLRYSQFTGIIPMNPQMLDVDNDNRPEIFGTMSASGNYRTNIPFSDSSTWFMVFNDKLKFEFPPVEFFGFANSLEIKAYNIGISRGYVLSHWVGGADTSILDSRILIYSTEGKLVSYRNYRDLNILSFPKLFVIKHLQSDKIYVLNDKFIELNEQLQTVRTLNIPFHSEIFPYQIDINSDGEDELMLYSGDEKKLAVYSSGLNKLTEIEFNPPSPKWKLYHYISKDQKHQLYLSSGDSGYFLDLKKNSFYYLGYLAYPGIYFLFFAFIVLIKRINTLQVIQNESLKQRLITLQLQGIKSQLDPHFTFNTLNSVASLIYLEDREAAYDYLNKFTLLLRGMVNDAERIYRTLSEELTFVTTYLDLEKLRFGEKFNYTVEIGEGITQNEQVPKLVLQTFAENAIKHGILPQAEGGLIKICIFREINYLKLTVEDNGIGRVNSEGHSTSTGKGLKLIGEFYDILNQINKKPIRHSITDLYNESGIPTGTRVDVWVPIDVQEVRSKK